MSEWQKIEIAPKGENHWILGWDGGNRAIIEWVDYGDGEGEWSVCHDAGDYLWSDYNPTHWQPLPEPPEDT